MKIQIRKSVFETNSSSVHTMVMCDKSDYDAWMKDKMMFNPDLEQFLTNESAKEYNKLVIEGTKIYEKDFYNYDDYIKEVNELKRDGAMYLTADEYFDLYVPEDFEDYSGIYKDVAVFGYYGEDR